MGDYENVQIVLSLKEYRIGKDAAPKPNIGLFVIKLIDENHLFILG